MKTPFILLLVLALNVNAQKIKPNDSLSVLFSIPYASQAIINLTETKLKIINGVEYRGYCETHNIFSVKINTALYRDENDFIAQLLSATGVDAINIKQGKEEDIFPFCEEYPNYWIDKEKASKK